MPISVFNFDDDLEKRIKNICYDFSPKDTIRRIEWEANQGIGIIQPGAKFSGFQSSNSVSGTNIINSAGGGGLDNDQRYEVSVEFQNVNLIDSLVTGYLTISNLTTEFPELTTFFEAEVIGKNYSFLTQKWDADEDIDRSHWCKFMGFTPDMDIAFQDPSFKYDFMNSRYIFMRWKEMFLVPDHKVSSINGASYEGFYYICADLQNELLDGFYYHHSSTMFQRLDLQFHRDRKFQSFEFR